MVVHRLLAAAIGLERLPEPARDKDTLRALADNLNTRHRNAQVMPPPLGNLHARSRMSACATFTRLPHEWACMHGCGVVSQCCKRFACSSGAQMAGRASVELHTLVFFKDREVVADARVTKARVDAVASACLCMHACA